MLIGIVGGVTLRLVVYFKAKNAKKFRQGVEYGSARWGNAKLMVPDPNGSCMEALLRKIRGREKTLLKEQMKY